MINSRIGHGVIFDMDGVLVDTGPYHKQAWYDLAAREDYRMSDEFFNNTFGMQNYQIIPQMTDRAMSREQVDRDGHWKEMRFRELISDNLSLLPGVERLIEDLTDSSFVMGVGSSGPRMNVEMVLETTGIIECFDVIVAGEDVTKGKPSPDTFLLAAELLGISPSRCVVIEDAIQGVQAAQAAGMAVVAVTNTRSREDLRAANRVVHSLAELTSHDLAQLITC